MKFLKNIKYSYLLNLLNNEDQDLFIVGPTEYISILDIKIIDIINKKVNINSEMIGITKLILKEFLKISYISQNLETKNEILNSVYDFNKNFQILKNKKKYNAFINKMFHIKEINSKNLYLTPEINFSVFDKEINISQHFNVNIISIALVNKSEYLFKDFKKENIKDELPIFLYDFFIKNIINVSYSDFKDNENHYLKIFKILNV